MSGDPAPEGSASEGSPSEAERRRRRAEVFGDVLPETTADERGETWNEGGSGASSASDRDKVDPSEEWLRRQVPPHHT